MGSYGRNVSLCARGVGGRKNDRFVLCCDCRIFRDFDPRFVSIMSSGSCGTACERLQGHRTVSRRRCARERANRPPVEVMVEGESVSHRKESISTYDTFDAGLQRTASTRKKKRRRAVDFIERT
jgi:hypothetical protein